MLYENTESGKTEQLKKTRIDIDDFIAQLDGISSVESTSDGLALLKKCNALCMRVNGAYGTQQTLFDAENKRLGDAYRKFWERMDHNG